MESRVRVARHPLHPMLVMFPTTLFPLLAGLDALRWWTGDDAFWSVGFWVALLGLATSLLAALAGIPDMAAIPNGHRAHRTGIIHAVVGTLTILAFAAASWARWNAASDDRLVLASAIDVVGLLLITAQGWLGGELVYRHHLGVKSPAEGGEPVVDETYERRVAERRRERPGL